jgi:tetratricopeptide (TPR) repeat protein
MSAFEREERLLEATGEAHMRSAVVHFANEGMFFWKIGRPLDARAKLERSQQINRERGTVVVDDAVSLVLKARIALQLREVQPAVAGFEQARRRALALGDVPAETVAIGEEVPALIEGRQFERAERALPAAERVLHTRYASDHWMFGVLRMQAALLAEQRGDSTLAQRLADEAIALFDAGSARTTYQMPITLIQRAGIEQRAGRYDAARADAERAVAFYDSHFGNGIRSASFGDALMALAGALKAGGDGAGARARMALAAIHYDSSLGPQDARTRAARAH